MYKPLYPTLRHWNKDWLQPEVSAAIESGKLSSIACAKSPGVFIIKLFTEDFCAKLLQEVEAFQATGLPRVRPNAQNWHGVILNELGFQPLFAAVIDRLISPLAQETFPERFKSGLCAADHHAFVVEYAAGKDQSLDLHFDDSDITVNICLGKSFQGGGLSFFGQAGKADEDIHEVDVEFAGAAHGLMHLGSHKHLVKKLEGGSRVNLLLWCLDKDNPLLAAEIPFYDDLTEHLADRSNINDSWKSWDEVGVPCTFT
ncbi:hypothetical protein CYMTET_26862 [Cymbomonas tetramitiformis]|uniref:Fe2OG dioxygenase domain-containing protein n=1 Tax=Cymbomonas tetramitiformis TaxID=36881 RepID=A0AAE0FR91_9CHLO|nr:hypothetical protein CYMTET_26862 [Cymbomonas tetramitiformis]